MKFTTTFKIYRSPPQTQTNQATKSTYICEQQSPMCMFVCFDLPTTTQLFVLFTTHLRHSHFVFLKQKICVESSKMSISLSKSY